MQSGSSYSDRELFGLIAEANEEAFRSIYDRYVEELYLAALKMTKLPMHAEEVVQETFIKLWVNRAKLPEVERPDAYLFRILYNHINDYLTKESNRERIIRNTLQYQEGSSNSTEEAVDVHESAKYVEQAINQLTSQQRTVYLLRRREGLSIDQIARRLNLSPSTVKAHLTRAQDSIRTYLKDIAYIMALLSAFRNFNSF